MSSRRGQLRPEFECEVQPQGFLRFTDVSRVVEHIQAGDLCLLPSDSSYILTGLATERGVTQDVDKVLQREGLEMSLASGVCCSHAAGQRCRQWR